MGNRTPRPPIRRDEDDDLVDDDPEDDEFDEDDNEFDDDPIDPLDMQRIVRERQQPTTGREWVEISATMESVTYAMEVTHGPASHGCLLRVVWWDLDGMISSSDPIWLGAVRLADLQKDSP